MPEPTVTPVDILIIGSGQAGNPLASAFAAKGKRVVVVESKHVGGTCVNEGCTPTKTMIASAKVAAQARRGAEYGVHTGGVRVDMRKVRERKRHVVDVWRSGSEKRLEAAENIELIMGLGRFVPSQQHRKTVEVALNGTGGPGGTRLCAAPVIVLNTGLRSLVPPGLGLEHVPYFDNESIMELDEVPGHLVILGGSYIAVEFAQMFRRFGAEVTIVSHGPQLLPREDTDIAACLLQIFKQDGIEILLNGKATGAAKTADGVSLTMAVEGAPDRTISGTHLLLAAGRIPNTDRLNLQAAGLQADEHGFLEVNERLETAVPGSYAVGDIKGGPAFTHIAYDDYRILAANLLEGGSRTTKDRAVPYTVFTDPELGRIGMTEGEALAAGHRIRVAAMPAGSIARAFETGDDRGLIKAVVDRDTEQILGAAMLAGEGGELAAIVQTAMMGKLPYTVLRDAVWAHPTWAESLNTLFQKFED